MTGEIETTAMVVRDETELSKPMSSQDMLQQVAHIQHVMAAVMRDNEHYGTIPGCGPKKTLLKPGAEKLGMTFGLVPSFGITLREYPNDHREYEIVCTLTHRATGRFCGAGVGICSTKEKKYRYRKGELKCPACEKSGTIIKGKAEYGGGWVCYAKKGGCGQKFADTAEAITSQDVGQVEHDNPADYYNTVLKMAKKRAHVDAIITATAASDIFAQDLEDLQANGLLDPPAPEPQKKGSQHPDTQREIKVDKQIESDMADGKPHASTKKPASDKQKNMIKGLMAQSDMPNSAKIAHLLSALGLTDAQKQDGLKRYGIDSLELASHEQMEKVRDGVFSKMSSAQASSLITALKPPDDEARAQALEIFNATIAKYGPQDVDVEGLMKAHFKVTTIAKLDAQQLTRLAELVEDHAKPQAGADDLPDYP